MAVSPSQKNRQTVSAFWGAMNDADACQISDIIKTYTHEDIAWYGPQPYNEIQGADGLIDRFWKPLLRIHSPIYSVSAMCCWRDVTVSKTG